MINTNKELDNYLMNTDVTNRIRLNVLLLIGFLIFGWAMEIAYKELGRKWLGRIYFIPYFILILLLTPLTLLLKDIYPLAKIAPVAIALVVYSLGWIHANIIFSRLQKRSKIRMLEIENQIDENSSCDLLLEKGLIEWKVYKSYKSALVTWSQAMSLQTCDAYLLNIIGVTLANKKYYKKAKEFFDLGLRLSSEKSQKEQIEDNLSYIHRKLK